jgi:hypothetical protein
MIGGLDTHETVKSLTAAGFTEGQAEAVTAAVKSAVDVDLSSLATKADLDALRVATKTDLEALRAVNRADLDALRAELEAQIERSKVEMIKWVVGIGFAQVAMDAALLRLIHT